MQHYSMYCLWLLCYNKTEQRYTKTQLTWPGRRQPRTNGRLYRWIQMTSERSYPVIKVTRRLARRALIIHVVLRHYLELFYTIKQTKFMYVNSWCTHLHVCMFMTANQHGVRIVVNSFICINIYNLKIINYKDTCSTESV